MYKTCFVVVGWNNKAILGECFESIFNQTYPEIHVIFVDNGSSDDSVAFVKGSYPQVEIIEPGYNSGFAKGNNIGITKALADLSVEYIVLLNSDARLAPDWTTKLIEFARQKPKGAMFQSITLDYYNHDVIDSTHIYISRNGQGTQGGWRFYYKSELGPRRVFGVNAAACMISRRFLDRQPFNDEIFDETMFMYLEDIDLAARAILLGWDNYLVPDTRAYHMGSASSGKNPGFSLYMTFRNNSAVLFKNLPLGMLIKMWPKIIRGDIDTIKTLRRTNRKPAVWKVVKGRIAGLLRLPLFIRKRRVMRQLSRIENDELWSLMRKGY